MATSNEIPQRDLDLGAQPSSTLCDQPENVDEPSQAAEQKQGLHGKGLMNTTRAELLLLETLHAEMSTLATPLQFAWNAVFQTVCVAIAFLFGVFAIFSWRGQERGNDISQHANQLAVIAICLTNNSSEIAGTCSDLLPKLSASFANIAAGSFGERSLGGASIWPWRERYDRNLSDPTGMIVMIVVPILCAGVGYYASSRLYRERFSR